MHKFALFFILALTASIVVVLSEPIFAEEMASGVPSDKTTGESSTTDEAMNEETTDDSSIGMEETTMESHVDSPLKQMSMGVDPHQIQCSAGHKLVFKASNWYPACVKESSFQTLSSWGWIANHDPSDDDLTMMMDDYMTKYPQETEQETETQMEESMDINDNSTSTNSTEQPEPKSSSIDLSESMEIGAQ